MKLNQPAKTTWWLSVVLALIALVSNFVTISFFSAYAFYILLLAFIILLLGTILKGF